MRNGYLDENPRPKYADGTPAHTKFILYQMRQYDLSKGEFPILTLRKIAWKSAIKEILWIFQKQSNDLSVLNEMGVHYWNDWDVGDLFHTDMVILLIDMICLENVFWMILKMIHMEDIIFVTYGRRKSLKTVQKD